MQLISSDNFKNVHLLHRFQNSFFPTFIGWWVNRAGVKDATNRYVQCVSFNGLSYTVLGKLSDSYDDIHLKDCDDLSQRIITQFHDCLAIRRLYND